MEGDYDPYSDNLRRPAQPARRDPFLVLSRSAWPATKGRHSRPHGRPADRAISSAPAAPEDERGVWEEESPFAGVRSFLVKTESGERIARIEAVPDIVDAAFFAGLDRLLSRYRPRPSLKAI